MKDQFLDWSIGGRIIKSEDEPRIIAHVIRHLSLQYDDAFTDDKADRVVSGMIEPDLHQVKQVAKALLAAVDRKTSG